MITRASIVEAPNALEGGSHFVRDSFLEHPMLVGLLDRRQRRYAGDLLDKCLFEPIRDLRERPSKEIRSHLVRLGGRIAASRITQRMRKNLDVAVEAVEMLHAGSLIVDDIEDGSVTRRGEPCIHNLYGVPIALNAANWLYFWPAHLIASMELSADTRLELHQRYHRTLLRSHFGQAIDVGLDMESVEQRDAKNLCLMSMELKTGALTAFALGMGALLGGVPGKAMTEIDRFGHGFGVALQMFDDLGNLKAANTHKQFEDLNLRRPSWVWAVASERSGREYREFVRAVQALPDRGLLHRWLEETNFHARAAKDAHEFIVRICRELETSVPPKGPQYEAFVELQRLGFSVERAYG